MSNYWDEYWDEYDEWDADYTLGWYYYEIGLDPVWSWTLAMLDGWRDAQDHYDSWP